MSKLSGTRPCAIASWQPCRRWIVQNHPLCPRVKNIKRQNALQTEARWTKFRSKLPYRRVRPIKKQKLSRFQGKNCNKNSWRYSPSSSTQLESVKTPALDQPSKSLGKTLAWKNNLQRRRLATSTPLSGPTKDPETGFRTNAVFPTLHPRS